MPAIKEAEYATDKYRSIHRWISMIVIIAMIAFAFESEDLRIGRTIKCCGFSFACIWFAEEIEDVCNILNSKWVRWGGWVLLLFYATIRLFLDLY